MLVQERIIKWDFVPIWLLNRGEKKIACGLSSSSLNSFSLQIKWLCLSALGIKPTSWIPVRSHDWLVISKAVATVTLDLTTGEMWDTVIYIWFTLWNYNLHVASYWKLKFLILVPLQSKLNSLLYCITQWCDASSTLLNCTLTVVIKTKSDTGMKTLCFKAAVFGIKVTIRYSS